MITSSELGDGNSFAVLDHSADMKLDRFPGHASRLVERRAGAYTAREVREIHAEIARSFLSVRPI
jgi:hypothetical protein